MLDYVVCSICGAVMTEAEVEQVVQALVAILEQASATRGEDGLNWGQISISDLGNRRPQTSKMDEVLAVKVQVIAALVYDGSTARLIGTALHSYMNRLWPKHLSIVRAIAGAEGLSVEETINEIRAGRLPRAE